MSLVNAVTCNVIFSINRIINIVSYNKKRVFLNESIVATYCFLRVGVRVRARMITLQAKDTE